PRKRHATGAHYLVRSRYRPRATFPHHDPPRTHDDCRRHLDEQGTPGAGLPLPQRVALPPQPEVAPPLRPRQPLRRHALPAGAPPRAPPPPAPPPAPPPPAPREAPPPAWRVAGAAVSAGGAGAGNGSAMNRRSRTRRFMAAACRYSRK